MGPWQVLLLRACVSLGVVAMKEYSTLPKVIGLELHYRMQFRVMPGNSLAGGLYLSATVQPRHTEQILVWIEKISLRNEK